MICSQIFAVKQKQQSTKEISISNKLNRHSTLTQNTFVTNFFLFAVFFLFARLSFLSFLCLFCTAIAATAATIAITVAAASSSSYSVRRSIFILYVCFDKT